MELLGQVDNKDMIEKWKTSAFPRFMIVTGEKGSGKKMLASYIAQNIPNCLTVKADKGVDVVREIIDMSYRVSLPTCYIFEDADKMSAQAKNALLKVTEEPPRQAYFIMTVEDINNTLVTLKSRGTEIKMEPYTLDDLTYYMNTMMVPDFLTYKTEDDITEITQIATNPGQCNQLASIDHNAFIAFCEKVIDDIAEVTGVNALKIGQYFKYKEDGEGYDIPLFFNCMMYALKARVFVHMFDYNAMTIYKHTQAIEYCSRYKNEMKITGIKKDATMDMFILDLRLLLQED